MSCKTSYLGPVLCVAIRQNAVLCASGSSVSAFDLSSGALLYSSEIYCGQRILGWWWSSAGSAGLVWSQRLLKIVLDEAAALTSEAELPEFEDRLLDARLLNDGDRSADGPEARTIVVAFAHNFIEIWVTGKDGAGASRQRRVQCSDVCLLYSARFVGTIASTLAIAVGTVYNQVLVWRPDGSASEKQGGLTPGQSMVEPEARLIGHEGVTFSLTWESEQGQRLVSVSDDRTVRVWQREGKSFALAWTGWGHRARVWDARFTKCGGVVSSGEDGRVIWWDQQGIQRCAMCTNIQNLWSVAYCSRAGADGVVAAGCHDGSVRLWELDASSPVMKAVTLPASLPEMAKNKCPVSHLAMLDEGRRVLVTAVGGESWLFDLLSGEKSAVDIVPIGLSQSSGRTRAASCLASSHGGKLVAVGSFDGWFRVTDLTVGESSSSSNEGGGNGVEWLAHKGAKAATARWLESTHDLELITASMDGLIKWWKWDQWEHGEGAGAPRLRVAASAGSKRHVLCVAVDQDAQLLYCGDVKGRITMFDTSAAAAGSCGSPLEPVCMAKRTSQTVQVTCLEVYQGTLFAAGFDSSVQQFLPSRGQDSHALRCVACWNSLPMGSVTHLWVLPGGQITAGGFKGRVMVIWDVKESYQLLAQIECGGWRRPHDLLLRWSGYGARLPAMCFTTLSACNTSLQCYRSRWQHGAPEAFQRHTLREVGHSKAVWAGRLVRMSEGGAVQLVTGSEDYSSKLLNCGGEDGTKLEVLQTLERHLSSTRAVAFSCVEQGQGPVMVFTGGGKLQLKAWKLLGQWCEPPMHCMVTRHTRAVRRVAKGMEEGHRILALAAWPAVDEGVHLVAVGDSEGFIATYRCSEEGKWEEAAVLQAAGRTVLCLRHFQVSGRRVLASGGTDGMVQLWDVALALDGGRGHPFAAYHAHSAGTNCLDVVQLGGNEGCLVCTGGDDQALTTAQLRRADGEWLLNPAWRLEGASGSAVRGLSAQGKVVFSVGLDCRLCAWEVTEELQLLWRAGWMTDVSECCDLDTVLMSDGSTLAVVVGQGVSVSSLR
ncbi:unnamed protein product, partial [Chrysoparadoxa australica]